MQIVSEQFRAQRPRWWQANGSIVVPIWVVESIKTSKKKAMENSDGC